MAIDAKFGPFPGDPAITQRRFFRAVDVSDEHFQVAASAVTERFPVMENHLRGCINVLSATSGTVTARAIRDYFKERKWAVNGTSAAVVSFITETGRASLKIDREAAIAGQVKPRVAVIDAHINELAACEAKYAFYALGQEPNVHPFNVKRAFDDLDALIMGWAVDDAKGPLFAGARAALDDVRARYSSMRKTVEARGQAAKEGIADRLAATPPLTDPDRAKVAAQIYTAMTKGGWGFFASELTNLAPLGQVQYDKVLDHVQTFGEIFARRKPTDPAATAIHNYAELEKFLASWAGVLAEPTKS